MNGIFEKIRNFLGEIVQFIRRFMGPDLSESELLEDEYNNDYFYRKISGFNELEPENRRILDEAMQDVVHEESKMSIEEALKTAKKDKLSIKSTEKTNTKTKDTEPTSKRTTPIQNKNQEVPKEPKSVDKDR